MAKTFNYTCDQCGNRIEGACTSIEVSRCNYWAEEFKIDLELEGDFCSWPCAVIWLTNQSHR